MTLRRRPIVVSCDALPDLASNALGSPPQYAAMLSNLVSNNAWARVAGSGAWNDADILEVGNAGLSDAEERSHFALWCLVKSPLLIGADLANVSQRSLDLLKNPELIAISQDELAEQGCLVHAAAGPNGTALPGLSKGQPLRLPRRATVAQLTSYTRALLASFGGVTDCELSAASVPEAQRWRDRFWWLVVACGDLW